MCLILPIITAWVRKKLKMAAENLFKNQAEITFFRNSYLYYMCVYLNYFCFRLIIESQEFYKMNVCPCQHIITCWPYNWLQLAYCRKGNTIQDTATQLHLVSTQYLLILLYNSHQFVSLSFICLSFCLCCRSIVPRCP